MQFPALNTRGIICVFADLWALVTYICGNEVQKCFSHGGEVMLFLVIFSLLSAQKLLSLSFPSSPLCCCSSSPSAVTPFPLFVKADMIRHNISPPTPCFVIAFFQVHSVSMLLSPCIQLPDINKTIQNYVLSHRLS